MTHPNTLSCLSCSQPATDVLIDFGPQPPSNRYETLGTIGTERHELVIGQCTACGMVQLVNPMAAPMVKSRFAWITYNEPEGHLDAVAEKLAALPGLDTNARIIGLTYKDDSTLARLNRKGFTNTYRYDPSTDLDLPDACDGLESIQAAFTDARVAALREKHGLADLLSVRHILEHAHHPRKFLTAIRALVKPDGYLWFEMPDCSKFIKACDYTFIWEEHIAYFDKETLENFSRHADFTLRDVTIYPYQFEDSLVAIAVNAPYAQGQQAQTAQSLSNRLKAGRAFKETFPIHRQQIRSTLERWKAQGKTVALFGAGHLGVKFINLYGIADLITCVVDDHPSKQGLLLPGSRVPIVGSAKLPEIDYCLLTLNSESEAKVRAKNQAYLEQGGAFYSIFAANHNSVYDSNAGALLAS